jgi:hypothetical protein
LSVSALPPLTGSNSTLAPLPDFLHARHLRRQLDGDALAGDEPLELLGHLAVEAGQDAVEILDDRHVGAEPLPHRAELQPDHAGADHHQVSRHLVELERPGRGHDDLLVDSTPLR